MTIQEILDNILHAVFGKDVRQSMHDGVKRANDICDDTKERQTKLETKYDLLLQNCTELSPSDSEIVDARIAEDGTHYGTLGERLNAMDTHDTESKTELEAARDKEDGTHYETLGGRLNYTDKDIKMLTESIERYAPRIGTSVVKLSYSAAGAAPEPEPPSRYVMEDKLITPNARVLCAYKEVSVTIPDGASVLAARAIDVSGLPTYAENGIIYFMSDKAAFSDEIFFGDQNLKFIYVRDVFGA